MDTITHGIVGALAGKALFAGSDLPSEFVHGGESSALSSPAARAAILACTIGSIFPDIDIFAGTLAHNPLAIMEWHRNITHSALILPIWALLLSALSIPLARWLNWALPPFLTLFVIYAVGIATHIFLDLATSFGTMVWSPLRYTRPAWDWIFIIDLTLTSIALVPQMAAWCYREPRHFWTRSIGVWAASTLGAIGAYFFAGSAGYGFSLLGVVIASALFAVLIFLPVAKGIGFRWTRAAWCRVALVAVCAYIALAAAAHHKALADVELFAAEQHLQVTSVAALPLPPTLTAWVGLVSTPDGVWRAILHEPGGAVESTQLYVDPQSQPFIAEAEKLRDVQIYLWFARFPVWRIAHLNGNETAIDISDARFFRERDPIAGNDPGQPRLAGSRAGRNGFTFEIVFDARGRILSHGFKEPE